MEMTVINSVATLQYEKYAIEGADGINKHSTLLYALLTS